MSVGVLQWLDRNGPFSVLIDGANVALYGQNWAQGGFCFDQISAAYEHAAAAYPDRKPLVVRSDCGTLPCAALRCGRLCMEFLQVKPARGHDATCCFMR